MSLPASRAPYIERVSFAYGDKPVHVTGADHDRQLRRERRLMTQDQIDAQPVSPHIDKDKYKQFLKEKSAKMREARKKRIPVERLGLPDRNLYRKPYEVPKAFREKVKRTAQAWHAAGAHNVERKLNEIEARSKQTHTTAPPPRAGVAPHGSPQRLFA